MISGGRSKTNLAEQPEIRGLWRVLPYLYIGIAEAADNKDELKRLGITTIVNCTDEVENAHPDDFKYVNYELDDTHEADASEHFDNLYEILAGVKEAKEKALIHCTDASSNSPTLAIAFMMMASSKAQKHLPLDKALKFIQGIEPGCRPEEHFLYQLSDLEKNLYGETSLRLKSRGGGGMGAGAKAKGRSMRGGGRGKGKRGK